MTLKTTLIAVWYPMIVSAADWAGLMYSTQFKASECDPTKVGNIMGAVEITKVVNTVVAGAPVMCISGNVFGDNNVKTPYAQKQTISCLATGHSLQYQNGCTDATCGTCTGSSGTIAQMALPALGKMTGKFNDIIPGVCLHYQLNQPAFGTQAAIVNQLGSQVWAHASTTSGSYVDAMYATKCGAAAPAPPAVPVAPWTGQVVAAGFVGNNCAGTSSTTYTTKITNVKVGNVVTMCITGSTQPGGAGKEFKPYVQKHVMDCSANTVTYTSGCDATCTTCTGNVGTVSTITTNGVAGLLNVKMGFCFNAILNEAKATPAKVNYASSSAYYLSKTSSGSYLNALYGDKCKGLPPAPVPGAPTVAPTPGPPGGPAAIQPCFSGDATVTKADGTIMRVDALKEGDAIVAATAEGKLTTDVVSLLSTAQPEVEATFLQISTDGGQELTVTPGHHLAVGDSCCSQLKLAKDVRAGDQLWMAHEHAATPVTITKIGATIETGTFSPVLVGGSFPVVDGLVTSFDAITQVKLKGLVPSFEALLRATGTADLARSVLFGKGRTFIDGFKTAPAEPSSTDKNSLLHIATAAGAIAMSA